MSHDEEGGAQGAPEVEGYKTFVIRGLNGVRVRGHRAVLTHGADGAFRRALVHWPALAAAGHALTTRLPVPEIETRAAAALAREGVTAGAIPLRWQYTPTAMTNGEIRLTLGVVATVPDDGNRGETRAVEVEVDAL